MYQSNINQSNINQPMEDQLKMQLLQYYQYEMMMREYQTRAANTPQLFNQSYNGLNMPSNLSFLQQQSNFINNNRMLDNNLHSEFSQRNDNSRLNSLNKFKANLQEVFFKINIININV